MDFKMRDKNLTSREESVLRMRLGIEEGARFKAGSGETVEKTRERIRQIEAKALRKLRHPSRTELIKILSR